MGFYITVAVLAISLACIWLIAAYKRNRLEVRVFNPHEPVIRRSNTEPVTTLAHPPKAEVQAPVEVAQPQAWPATLSLGFPEIDRLVAVGDWNSARAALQRIAYTMPDADAPTKAAFTAVMTKFASQDPLFAQVLNAALPAIEQSPGLKQADLYRDMSDDKKELIRYVLYFAAELGKIVRVKRGNSYALYLPGSVPLPIDKPKRIKKKS